MKNIKILKLNLININQSISDINIFNKKSKIANTYQKGYELDLIWKKSKLFLKI